ncbi:hypothetical protein [Nostoc sp. MS1]|uniref:hypothetical protein n=1 Tax=Nostoc sp. MS1 TaxID=2764711 RepID=UPI001CC43D64|nr:hypothetical protein [Nostoc sp. MS1]BCL35809.1 hypothetical protein NSMS1_22560 [Nostoc sp. MS1]
MEHNTSIEPQDNYCYEQIVDQLLFDNIFNLDNCDNIIKIPSIEIKIEGRPLSFQNKNKQNNSRHNDFKEKVLEKIDKFDYFIINRVQIEIQLYIKEMTLYEDHTLIDIDNIPKNLIDILHQSFPKGILIEDTQVDKIISERIRILPKPGISCSEHFLICISPINESEIYAIKKNDIIFIPIIKGEKSNSKLYYPVPKSNQEIIDKTQNLFECLNNIKYRLKKYTFFWIYLFLLVLESGSGSLIKYISRKLCVSVEEYMLSIGMLSGTVFPSRILRKGFKSMP